MEDERKCSICGKLHDTKFKINEAAEKYYQGMRNSNTNLIVESICKSFIKYTNQSEKESIQKVSNAFRHAILNKYPLFDLETGTVKEIYFVADYGMMQSFQRLRFGKPLEHDIIVIEHENMEYLLMKENPNLSYEDAHIITAKVFNCNKYLN